VRLEIVLPHDLQKRAVGRSTAPQRLHTT
jgi:hypothetical protein